MARISRKNALSASVASQALSQTLADQNAMSALLTENPEAATLPLEVAQEMAAELTNATESSEPEVTEAERYEAEVNNVMAQAIAEDLAEQTSSVDEELGTADPRSDLPEDDTEGSEDEEQDEQPEEVATIVPLRNYVARRYQPTQRIALGPARGKPGTVAYWLRGQLALTLATKTGEARDAAEEKGEEAPPPVTSCTVGEWIATVIANRDMCPSRSKPVRDIVYAQFCNGYLRWQLKHRQIVEITD